VYYQVPAKVLAPHSELYVQGACLLRCTCSLLVIVILNDVLETTIGLTTSTKVSLWGLSMSRALVDANGLCGYSG
jgi:hypothetical protein